MASARSTSTWTRSQRLWGSSSPLTTSRRSCRRTTVAWWCSTITCCCSLTPKTAPSTSASTSSRSIEGRRRRIGAQMAKELRYNEEARRLLVAGVDKLANAVRVTLGPMGRNAVLEKLTGPPTITNDGVTISREIELRAPFANMGAQLVKEVAMKTNGLVGDGPTPTTIMAQPMLREGLRAVDAGANPMRVRRGIERTVPVVIDA